MKTMKRKMKRALKKGAEDSETDAKVGLNDRIGLFSSLRCSGKVRSFDFTSSNQIGINCGLGNNSIETYELNIEESKTATARLSSAITLPGHRSDIRSVALSDDDTLVLTGSSDQAKIYSTATGSCLQTLESGYVLCSSFLPGNQHIVLGTKTGDLQLYDMASSSLIEEIHAHEGPIWSLQILPDRSGMITGSQDKLVKFWSFVLIDDPQYSTVCLRP